MFIYILTLDYVFLKLKCKYGFYKGKGEIRNAPP